MAEATPGSTNSGIMSRIFGNFMHNPGGPAPAAPAPNPAAASAAANPTVPGPGNVNPNPGSLDGRPDPANPAAPLKDESPLANFAKLWENPVGADGKPVPQPDLNAPIVTADPAKVLEAVKKIDLTKSISSETWADIQAGGEKGVAATQKALREVTEQTLSAGMMAATQMVNAALDKQRQRFEAQLPSQVRLLSLSENLAENPIFTNPATKPIMDAIQIQISKKHPNASTADLKKAALEYVDGMVKLSGTAGNATPDPKVTVPSGLDWVNWAERDDQPKA